MEAPVLRFVITGGTLSAMWTESARSVPNYPSSSQARNCLWVISAHALHMDSDYLFRRAREGV